jgi:alanyl-tRNA synthetase
VTTERLYYTDSYLRQFTARVVDRQDEGRRLYLDRTAFYPTSGGQPHDTGTISGVPLLDVVDEEDRVAHVLAAPVAETGVECRIDWPRRHDLMQQHTGQHLLSAVLADQLHHATVSVHFGPGVSTLDLDTGSLEAARLQEAEAAANAVVTSDLAVQIEFEDASSARGLRRPTDRQGPIRVVTIEGVDRSACGGTHVRRTGEIGPILIRGVERVKQQIRIEFLCGARATARARMDFELLHRMGSAASVAMDEVPQMVERLRQEQHASEQRRRELEEAVSGYRVRELYAATSPGPDGRRVMLLPVGDTDLLPSLARAAQALPRSSLVVTCADPPTVLLAVAADAGVNAADLLKTVLTELGGRGGGSPQLARGTVPGPAELAAAGERLCARLGPAPSP